MEFKNKNSQRAILYINVEKFISHHKNSFGQYLSTKYQLERISNDGYYKITDDDLFHICTEDLYEDNKTLPLDSHYFINQIPQSLIKLQKWSYNCEDPSDIKESCFIQLFDDYFTFELRRRGTMGYPKNEEIHKNNIKLMEYVFSLKLEKKMEKMIAKESDIRIFVPNV